MIIEHTVALEVKDANEAEQVKKALDEYQFIGQGVLDLDKKIKARDILVTLATKNFIRRK